MATFYGPATVNHPVSGDMRQNNALNCVEVYNGSSWTPVTPGWEKQETLSESVAHALDDIGSYIEEDCPDNVTIQDAYQEWKAATEKFCVILTMAEK
jgi:hypothetical protein